MTGRVSRCSTANTRTAFRSLRTGGRVPEWKDRELITPLELISGSSNRRVLPGRFCATPTTRPPQASRVFVAALPAALDDREDPSDVGEWPESAREDEFA
jgi:hypothetical protein